MVCNVEPAVLVVNVLVQCSRRRVMEEGQRCEPLRYHASLGREEAIDHAFSENTTKLVSRALSGRSNPNSSWSAPRSLLEADLISILSLACRYGKTLSLAESTSCFPSDERRPTAVSPALLEVMFHTYLLCSNTGKRVFRLRNYCFAPRREAIPGYLLCSLTGN
ncbi:hypothetical protein CEXT_560361 [Caerostris extrusa]|uniref:Uncharacterized protein n=1 Tax=Caerostris extrusa TaxID=172846 RepID=A0AAV4MK49_CAEEX|nr:hypothetical protein CEXT_560361 [Caerostris extrusa]